MKTVAVLFARQDSVYKTMPGCDVWDIERDARRWPGGSPVVAHPPCRAWGRLAYMANPRPDEKDLARWAVSMVRHNGGVLEHPAASKLWEDQGLGRARPDEFGGWTLPIQQKDFGHKAEKKTLLYIVGAGPEGIPGLPLVLGNALWVIAQSGRRRDGSRAPNQKREVTKAEREHTPPALAEWLVELARRCSVVREAETI